MKTDRESVPYCKAFCKVCVCREIEREREREECVEK